MRLINADVVKQKYRDKFIKSLVDKDRGIDLSEYTEEPSKSFNRFIDEIPTVDVFDKISAEVEQIAYPIVHGVNNHEKGMTLYGILQIIDKYR